MKSNWTIHVSNIQNANVSSMTNVPLSATNLFLEIATENAVAVMAVSRLSSSSVGFVPNRTSFKIKKITFYFEGWECEEYACENDFICLPEKDQTDFGFCSKVEIPETNSKAGIKVPSSSHR